jgi:hypothetical protein
MAVQWFFELFGEEVGPVNFQELVAMIRSGKLTGADRVRQEGAADWVRVEEVTELIEAVAKPSAEAASSDRAFPPSESPLAAEVPEAIAAAQSDPTQHPWIGPHGRMVGAAALVALLAAGFWGWQRYARRPLPQGSRTAPANQPEQTTFSGTVQAKLSGAASAPYDARVAAAVNRAKTSSVPGLKPGVPQLVPGLEKIDKSWILSLSNDLCQIVFNAPQAQGKKGCLYTATRPNVSSPFRNVQPIASCQSMQVGKTTMSPDGLEIIFLATSAGQLQFFYCQRSSTAEEFDEPISWPTPGVVSAGHYLCMARFLDPRRVLITADAAGASTHASFFIAERADRQSAFGPPKELFVGDGCGGHLCLRPNLLIGYIGYGDGIFVRGRENLQTSFSKASCLIEGDVCGVVNAPSVWVAPGDDVVFYVSPGPGRPKGPGYIWMVRF